MSQSETPEAGTPSPPADGQSLAGARGPRYSSPHVASAVAGLDRIAETPLAEHPDGYQRIHAELQTALASIDDA